MEFITQLQISLPISSLQTDTTQPRKSFDEEALQALRESIRSKGVLRALLVKRISRRGGNDVFSIIDGERRFRAARGLDMVELPCIEVTELSDMEVLEVQLTLDFTTEKFMSAERDEAINRYYEMLMKLPKDVRDEKAGDDKTDGWIINYIQERTHVSRYVIRFALDKRAFKKKNEDFDKRMRNLIEQSNQESMQKRYNAATEVTGRIKEFRDDDEMRRAVIAEYVQQSRGKGQNTIDAKGLEAELRDMVKDDDMSKKSIKRRLGTKLNAAGLIKNYMDKLNKLNADLILLMDDNKIKKIDEGLVSTVVASNKEMVSFLKKYNK